MDEQIINTTGAAQRLGCSETWIHKLVYRNLLRAHMYNKDGVLIPRQGNDKRQGQGLYFYDSDIEQYQRTRRPRGRPKGSKNKAPRKTKTLA